MCAQSPKGCSLQSREQMSTCVHNDSLAAVRPMTVISCTCTPLQTPPMQTTASFRPLCQCRRAVFSPVMSVTMPPCSIFTGYVNDNAAVQYLHRLCQCRCAVLLPVMSMPPCSIFTGYVTMSLCSIFAPVMSQCRCAVLSPVMSQYRRAFFFFKPAMSQYRRSIFTGYVNAAVQYFHRLCQCRCSIFIGCQCRLGPRPAPPVSCTYTNDRRSKCGLHAVINVYTVYMTHTVCWAAAL